MTYAEKFYQTKFSINFSERLVYSLFPCQIFPGCTNQEIETIMYSFHVHIPVFSSSIPFASVEYAAVSTFFSLVGTIVTSLLLK